MDTVELEKSKAQITVEIIEYVPNSVVDSENKKYIMQNNRTPLAIQRLLKLDERKWRQLRFQSIPQLHTLQSARILIQRVGN